GTDNGPFCGAGAGNPVEPANQIEQRCFWSSRILRYGQQSASQHGGTEKRCDRHSEGRGRTAAQNAVGRRIRPLQRPSDRRRADAPNDPDPAGGRKMAGIFRGQGSAIARSLALLPALLFAVVVAPAAMAQLYDQPLLVVEPGMHTAPIKAVAVDAAGHLAVTGSYDKTVRVWSLTDGKLLQTIRMPAGPGEIGKIYAVAVSPDGELIAAGGWTANAPDCQIYLLETRAGKMTARIGGLAENTNTLA